MADGKNVLIGAIVEHIENAGVHSGDATMAIPPQTITEDIIQIIQQYTNMIALALKIIGPFNIQYLVKDEGVYVIECNLRSSRSMPYVSKARGINLMKLAAEVIMGNKLPEDLKDLPYGDYVAIKAPMFSFVRLDKADYHLGVEMSSTGEVGCIGEDFPDSLHGSAPCCRSAARDSRASPPNRYPHRRQRRRQRSRGFPDSCPISRAR